jgi:cytoskeleton protein RodZ
MLSPGAQLRAARERAGWTAARLAAELCLPVDRLRALEEDDHASFGGVVFVRGYLRRAAALLGLSPNELIVAFENCCDTRRPAEILPGPIVGRPPRRAAPGWIGPAFGTMAVVVAAAGSWWVMGPGQDVAPMVVAGGDQSPAGLEFSVPAETQQAPAPRIVVAETPPASEPTPEPAAELVPAADLAPDERVVQAPEPAPPPLGTAELRFEFSEDCWLEVADADEKSLAYRLYRAGDVARLRGKAPLEVFLGNAEGVRLTVNGSPIAVRPAARRDGTARLTVGGGAG